MEKHFDLELADLKSELLRMGTLVEQAIFLSVESLKSLNKEKAEQIIADDKLVDNLENAIDEKCLDLLALRQPLAVDLRFVAMVMKITTDLERMADLAVDIAQRVLDLAGQPLLKPLIDTPKLAEVAKRMTREALDAFVNKNAELAKKIIYEDNEADKLRNLIQKELLDEYMSRDPSTASRALPLLLTARHLERICDHATNIAEDVIFMLKAQVVKHHPERL